MQTAPATFLASGYASDYLKERYANISTIKACDDIKTNPNYPTCLAEFNEENVCLYLFICTDLIDQSHSGNYP